ncbi:Ribosome-recycling factor [Escovopsis weberi]|uniref:Ribosome-recycling factor n=1 Tax=Escovopsis weberi TaxID=150374 RepID=A0A0M8MXN4_ESCWE|nr:Ribosome-recycling factor [Escovopsis weberi]
MQQQQQQQQRKQPPENPLDMSALTAAYAAADAHFRAEIQQVLHGGRFNPDSLGAVPVPLKHSASPPSNSSSSSHSSSSSSAAPPTETFHLRELAQIVPRPGRTISLLVNDRRYIKDIMSAIQKSPDFNQQPQRSADNELELLLRVELERKDDLARRVRDACRAWRERVRQARTRHEKTLQDWKKAKLVLPDVIRKAEREMQKVQDKKMKEVDQEEAQALKQLDRQ